MRALDFSIEACFSCHRILDYLRGIIKEPERTRDVLQKLPKKILKQFMVEIIEKL